jgi:hypothetical protein
MIAPLIYKAIIGNAQIANELAQYASAPAVFTQRPPGEIACPFIVINERGGPDFGTRGDKGGTAQLDVQVFDDKQLSAKEVRLLARRIRALLHRNDLEPWATEAGLEVISCIANLPANTNDDLGFPGYTIPVQVQFLGT